MLDALMELFKTERISARRLALEDAEAMQAIYGDVDAMRFVGDGRPLTVEICRHWIEVTDGNFERRGYGMIALVERLTDELIGCIGVVHPDQQEDPEVKYAFRGDKWGQGFATEAVKGIVSYAKFELGKNWLTATVDPDHSASQSVLRKAGFRHTKDRKNEDGSVTQVWEINL